MGNTHTKKHNALLKQVEKVVQSATMYMLHSNEFKTIMHEVLSDIIEINLNKTENKGMFLNSENSGNCNKNVEEKSEDLNKIQGLLNEKEKELSDINMSLITTKEILDKKEQELKDTQITLSENEKEIININSEIGSMKEILGKKEEELLDISSKLKNTEETLSKKEEELLGISSKLKNTEETLSKKETELFDISSKLESTEETLSKKEGELLDIGSKLESTEETLSKKEEKLLDIGSELESTKETLSKREEELLNINQELENAQKSLAVSENDLKETRELLLNKEAELEGKSQELETTSSHLKALTREFIETTEQYVEVYNLMCKCDSMKSFLDEYIGVSEERKLSISETIKLVNVIGNDFALARNVYIALDKYKNVNQEYLTGEELACIRAINELYASRTINPCNYVVLDCLSLESGEQKDFKRKIMRDLNMPGCTDFAYALGVYVPALKTEDSNDYERKAIVKGD